MRSHETCFGPITGLRLPFSAWLVLERENVRTLDQLKAVASRIEQLFDGIGAKTAHTIRVELTRLASPVKD